MIEIAQFLWGTPDEVRARVRTNIPQFRLTHPAGALPAAGQTMACPEGRNVRRVKDGSGRVVGTAWEDDAAHYLFLAGVCPPDLAAPRETQAADLFPHVESLLKQEGFAFSDVVRTWLYIDRVCEWYGAFNAARSAFFEARNVFNTFLPASTGIGTANLEGAALIAGAVAMRPKSVAARAEIVESPLQAPAMAYKSSFSRAAEMLRPDAHWLFISGTASIKPNSHDVAYVGDIVRQIACTMKAVAAILESRGYGWRDVSRAIVYLKDPSFREPWQAWLAAAGLPADFAMETVCDVCRDEWLFEIECDGIRAHA